MPQQREVITEDPAELIRKYGRDILDSPGFQQMKQYRHHDKSTTYQHSLDVTMAALRFAKSMRIPVDKRALVRGCLLHDYYLYNHHTSERKKWHWARHDLYAAINADRDFGIDDREADIIANHVWPIHPMRFPLMREGWILVLADKKVAAVEAIHGVINSFID